MDNNQLAAFLEKVLDMRNQQISYFATRSKLAMFRAKELEKEVDKQLPNLIKTVNDER